MIGSNLVMPGWLSQEEYQQLYQATFQAVKSVHPDLCVGGPGGFSSSIWSGSQFRTFFEFTVREGCVPDFVSFQCQPHEFVERDKAFLEFTLTHHSSPAVLSADEHYLRSTISQMKKLLEAFHLEDREIWIEEWNSTLWQRDLSNDLCYKAAWLTKNIRENTDDAEAFGYWMLTDYSEERSALKSIFHGGYGLFTYTGIPKSGWYAMKLLNMLGENLIDRGDGWIFTGGRSGFQLLLDHYAHYDDLFRYRYQIIADPSKAYDVFITKGRIFYEINISGLEKGTYVIRRIHISRKHGSSFDAWLSMGRPPYLSEEEQTYLTHISAPHYHTGTAEVEETLHLECILNQHEVEMIIIEKADLKNNEII